jgi:hypothetical protein
LIRTDGNRSIKFCGRRIGEKALVFIVAEEFVGRSDFAGVGMRIACAKTNEEEDTEGSE